MNRIERMFSSLVIRNSVALVLFLFFALLSDYYSAKIILSGKDIPGLTIFAVDCLIATVFSIWANWFSFKSIQNRIGHLVLRTTLIIVMILIMLALGFLVTVHVYR